MVRGNHAPSFPGFLEMMEHEVCKTFFLHTLGYKSDNVVTVPLKSKSSSLITPHLDQKGKHPPPHAMTDVEKENIQLHIESYRPCVSHYRREHVPNRRYLPSDVTIQEMYNNYKADHSAVCCVYNTY